MDEDLQTRVIGKSDLLIRELHSEMRAIREADLKILPFFYASSALVLPAHVLIVLNANAEMWLLLSVAVPLFLFVCVMWWSLHRQLEQGHANYEDLGKRIQAIWSLWGVSPFCAPRPGAAPLGSGRGYRRAQLYLAFPAICVLIILSVTTLLKLRSLLS